MSRSDIGGLSIRSALFALKNNGVIAEAAFKDLDRSWKKHKAKLGLDPYGREEKRRRVDSDGEPHSC